MESKSDQTEQEYKAYRDMSKELLNSFRSTYKGWVNHWGIKDAWNIIETIQAYVDFIAQYHPQWDPQPIQQTEEYRFVTTVFMNSNGPQNQAMWRGLSGSDDLAWAAICQIHAYMITGDRKYLDYKSKANKARGAIQLFKEIESHYTDKNGGIFWDYNRSYKASISNELYIVLSALLFKVTLEKNYLDIAVSCTRWLFEQSGVFQEDGSIQDGVSLKKGVDPNIWTYNQGVILGGLVYLYEELTENDYQQKDDLIKKGIKIADFATTCMIQNGIFCEFWPHKLNNSAKQFKGIFFRNLAIFTRFLIKNNMYPEKAKRYKEFIIQHAQHIYLNCRDTKTNSFFDVWHRKENLQCDQISTISGITTILAAQSLFLNS